MSFFRQRWFTKKIIKFYTHYLPSALMDAHFVKKMMAAIYYGKRFMHFDMYFKEKAPYMNEEEFVAAYENSPEGWHEWSETDCTPKVIQWIYSQLNENDRIVDMGGGGGGLWRDYPYPQNVTIVDMIDQNANGFNPKLTYVKSLAHQTQFSDKGFDVAISSHVLEHVIYFTKTIRELIRISKRQIIVVPKQIFERFTLDYHVNFFPSKEQFLLRLIDSSVDGSRCKVLDVDDEICTILESEPQKVQSEQGH